MLLHQLNDCMTLGWLIYFIQIKVFESIYVLIWLYCTTILGLSNLNRATDRAACRSVAPRAI